MSGLSLGLGAVTFALLRSANDSIITTRNILCCGTRDGRRARERGEERGKEIVLQQTIVYTLCTCTCSGGRAQLKSEAPVQSLVAAGFSQFSIFLSIFSSQNPRLLCAVIPVQI